MLVRASPRLALYLLHVLTHSECIPRPALRVCLQPCNTDRVLCLILQDALLTYLPIIYAPVACCLPSQILRTRSLFGHLFAIAIVWNVGMADTILTALLPTQDFVGIGDTLPETAKQVYYGWRANLAGGRLFHMCRLPLRR